MCGIAGATSDILGSAPEKTLERMNAVMVHRGPDMGEYYLDSRIGLCHRRLSIIDLTEDGRQPMTSRDGRYLIVFNGEIYNFQELKEGLEAKGYGFSTRTDTEVLLNLYAEHGPDLLHRIRGMFAFAIWDRVERKLFCARDRIGKKPFYYYRNRNGFAFASEMKSLLEIRGIEREIEYTALIDYLKYLFIPDPKTIYKNIHKLEPGHYLIFQGGRIEIREYWDVDFSGEGRPDTGYSARGLLDVIDDAVRCRLVSDVPLGAFLSGGVDSSGVVALMARASAAPVTTCSIGFDSKKHNEAQYARAFARQLGTEHHEYYVHDDPASLIKKLVWHFDEPFADSSMVPTYNVSCLARRNVTVALSGDGGDESFAGYEKYSIDRLENRVREAVPGALLGGIASVTDRFRSGILKKVNSLCRSAGLHPSEAFYVTNTFITDGQLHAILNKDIAGEISGYNPEEHIRRYYEKARGPDHLSKILYTDLKMYLPGDILVKVDRMSMANSLEVRSPLLDHKVIEYAAKMPSHFKMRGGEKKYILKEAFRNVLPCGVLERRKQGFEVPLDGWFRQELRQAASDALFQNPRMDEFFNVRAIGDIWEDHQSRRVNHGTLLWTLFVFSLWTGISRG